LGFSHFVEASFITCTKGIDILKVSSDLSGSARRFTDSEVKCENGNVKIIESLVCAR
jgi:hypothetical protein